jgi:putative Mn2+ efflux pump MntP
LSLVDLFILAIALGMDCLIVSFSQGLIFKSNKRRNSFLLACTMGFFQGFMPCISYVATDFVDHYIEPYADIIVFLIFLTLGAKFIAGAFFHKEDEISCIDWKCLMGMGIATSIDALASGVGLQLTKTPMMLAVLIIGFISFFMSLSGFWLGYFFKKLPSKILEISGGLILIALALKIFFVR